MREHYGYVIDEHGNRLALYFDEPLRLNSDPPRDPGQDYISWPPPDADYMLESGTRLNMRIDGGRVSYHDCNGRAYIPERQPGRPS